MFSDIILFAAVLMPLGLLTGFMAGLLGIGGGIIMVPAMQMLLVHAGYSEAIAVPVALGTSMAVILPTGITSARAHHRKGAVNFPIFRQMAPGIVLGVILGGFAAYHLSADILKILFGVVAIMVAVIMVVDPARYRLGDALPSRPVNVLMAAVFGFCSSLMGVAGGAMNVPYLSLFNVPMHHAVGTAAALGVFTALPATLSYMFIGWNISGLPPLSLGYVSVLMAALLLPGSIFAAPYGVAVAHKLPVKQLRLFFALFILAIALRMIVTSLG